MNTVTSNTQKSLNIDRQNKEGMDGKRGQSHLRYELGSLDLISAIIVVIGVYLIQSGNGQIGGIIVVLGILKQFSGI